MSYASIDDLRSQLGATAPRSSQVHTPEYAAKMLHPLPDGQEVDRAKYILAHVVGKRVLEFGATGPMHDAVVKVARCVHGIDRHDGPGVTGFDLDDVSKHDFNPPNTGVAWTWTPQQESNAPDLILCGEVIEHLSNPGWFLTRLKRQYPGVPVLITVPNAFTAAGRKHLSEGVENVNVDHVAWYSPHTLKTLLARAGYTIREFAWYNGAPPHSEGLIVLAE